MRWRPSRFRTSHPSPVMPLSFDRDPFLGLKTGRGRQTQSCWKNTSRVDSSLPPSPRKSRMPSLICGPTEGWRNVSRDEMNINWMIPLYSKSTIQNGTSDRLLNSLPLCWCLQKRLIQEMDSGFYVSLFFSFLENIERTAKKDYRPTDQDILHTRMATTGVVKMDFHWKGFDFK